MDDQTLIAKIKDLKTIQPDENWVVFCRQEIQKNIEKVQPEETPQLNVFAGWSRLLMPVLRPVGTVLGILLLLTSGSAMVVAAAQKSLPGDWLFPAKIALERIQMKLVADDTERTKLEGEIIGRRAQELSQIMSQTSSLKEAKVEQAVQEIKAQLSNAGEQLPKLKEKARKKTESGKLVEAAKSVQENTNKLEQALSQAKNNLSENLSEDKTLSATISDISDTVRKNKAQTLEILETIENTNASTTPVSN